MKYKDALLGVYDIECIRDKKGNQIPFCIELIIDENRELFYGFNCIK